MTQYSALLLAPDYVGGGQYGENTFYCHVTASDVDGAIRRAQVFASAAYSDNAAADDFLPLLVVEGWHENLVGQF